MNPAPATIPPPIDPLREQDAPPKGSATTLAIVLVTISLSAFYLIVRTWLFVETDVRWYEKLVAGLLLLAEAFVLLHGIGYFLNVIHAKRHPQKKHRYGEDVKVLEKYPPVAVIVSSYREPLEVVTDTLICFRNLTYPNARLFFLDDTRYDVPAGQTPEMQEYRRQIERLCEETEASLFRRKWHGAKAGMINDFLDFVAGRHKEGFEFTNFQGVDRTEPEKYIIVFDADMNPLPDFVEALVETLEERPELAFVQTPQYYSNFENNRVARAAGLQQAVFYEYICEGKSAQDAMFCCGTNVMFRREALEDVGGLDDTSVTEDFATSLKFHLKGWQSTYLNRIAAFGMGPEDLGGFFKQQFRWALGTTGLLRTTIGGILLKPGSMPLAKCWEYFLSGSHYLVGWVFFILWLCPVLYLFAGVPAYFARPGVFLCVFFPYLAMTFFAFFFTLRQRAYGVRDVFSGMLLTTICFPVYMKATTLGLLGVKGSFGITPKGGSTSLPLSDLWVQAIAIVIGWMAAVWGLTKAYYTGIEVPAHIVNAFWCIYSAAVLSTIFYFNTPEEK